MGMTKFTPAIGVPRSLVESIAQQIEASFETMNDNEQLADETVEKLADLAHGLAIMATGLERALRAALRGESWALEVLHG